METVGLLEGARLLRCHHQTLREKAVAKEIPGRKVGRAWVFNVDDLAAYLRGDYSAPAREQASTVTNGANQCQSINATTAGMSISQHQTESELDALLGQ